MCRSREPPMSHEVCSSSPQENSSGLPRLPNVFRCSADVRIPTTARRTVVTVVVVVVVILVFVRPRGQRSGEGFSTQWRTRMRLVWRDDNDDNNNTNP